jgi:hypothetical protein
MVYRGKVNIVIKTHARFIIKDAKTGIIRKLFRYYRFALTDTVYARTYSSIEISMGEITYFLRVDCGIGGSPYDLYRYRQRVNNQGEVIQYVDHRSNHWEKDWGLPCPFSILNDKTNHELLRINSASLNKKYRDVLCKRER